MLTDNQVLEMLIDIREKLASYNEILRDHTKRSEANEKAVNTLKDAQLEEFRKVREEFHKELIPIKRKDTLFDAGIKIFGSLAALAVTVNVILDIFTKFIKE